VGRRCDSPPTADPRQRFDAGTDLQDIEDIVILKRVPTPPRWLNDTEED
jgi:hypothetical protein